MFGWVVLQFIRKYKIWPITQQLPPSDLEVKILPFTSGREHKHSFQFMTLIPALSSTVPPPVSTSFFSTCIFQASCLTVIKISKYKVHVIVTIKGNQDTSACLMSFSIPIFLSWKGSQIAYFWVCFYRHTVFDISDPLYFLEVQIISISYHAHLFLTCYTRVELLYINKYVVLRAQYIMAIIIFSIISTETKVR